MLLLNVQDVRENFIITLAAASAVVICKLYKRTKYEYVSYLVGQNSEKIVRSWFKKYRDREGQRLNYISCRFIKDIGTRRRTNPVKHSREAKQEEM
jgi:hypothetical protein